MSLARDHFTRVLAGQAGGGGESEPPPEARSLRARLGRRLALHRQTLKGTQSVTRKIAVKREILPEYMAYVDGVLAADAPGPDPVLMTVLVWRLDVGDYAGALAIAHHALRHDLALPDTFARDLPTWLVEDLAEAVLEGQDAAVPALAEALALTADTDMPDEVRAKALKARGLSRKTTEPAEALADLEQALALHKGAGVKTEIARLRRALDGDGADPRE